MIGHVTVHPTPVAHGPTVHPKAPEPKITEHKEPEHKEPEHKEPEHKPEPVKAPEPHKEPVKAPEPHKEPTKPKAEPHKEPVTKPGPHKEPAKPEPHKEPSKPTTTIPAQPAASFDPEAVPYPGHNESIGIAYGLRLYTGAVKGAAKDAVEAVRLLTEVFNLVMKASPEGFALKEITKKVAESEGKKEAKEAAEKKGKKDVGSEVAGLIDAELWVFTAWHLGHTNPLEHVDVRLFEHIATGPVNTKTFHLYKDGTGKTFEHKRK